MQAALFEDPDVGTLFCKCMIHLLELFDDIDAMAALFQILSLLNVEQFSELLQEVGSGKLIPFIINEDEDLVFQFLGLIVAIDLHPFPIDGRHK